MSKTNVFENSFLSQLAWNSLNKLPSKKFDGLKLDVAGSVNYNKVEYPIYFLKNEEKDHKKSVLITAGIHGSEPASVLATIKFMNDFEKDFGSYFNITIFPCLNPFGLSKYVRENGHNENINRSFIAEKVTSEAYILANAMGGHYYDMAINVHEDNPKDGAGCPDGFYMYMISNRKDKDKGKNIINNIAESGYEITARKQIYLATCNDGLIWSDLDDSRTGTLEEYLQGITKIILTPELPATWQDEKRINCLNKSIEYSLIELI